MIKLSNRLENIIKTRHYNQKLAYRKFGKLNDENTKKIKHKIIKALPTNYISYNEKDGDDFYIIVPVSNIFKDNIQKILDEI